MTERVDSDGETETPAELDAVRGNVTDDIREEAAEQYEGMTQVAEETSNSDQADSETDQPDHDRRENEIVGGFVVHAG